MQKILLMIAVLAVVACGEEITAPTPSTPINDMTLTQFGNDSLRVTFAVTTSYDRAVLLIRRFDEQYQQAEEISRAVPREFRIRWADWIDVDGGMVGVRIYYGTGGAKQYAWFRAFTPKIP